MSAEPITTGPRHRVDPAPHVETHQPQSPVIEGDYRADDAAPQAYRTDPQPPVTTPLAPAPAGRRTKWPLALAIVVVVLGGLIGGGAFATNAYAKGRVCDDIDAAVASATAAASATTPTMPDPAAMRVQVEDTRLAARMLMFDGALQTAVTALAAGTERTATLIEKMATATPEQQGALLPELGAANVELGTLVGNAQVACGR